MDREHSEWEKIGPFQVNMNTKHLNLEQLYSQRENIKWRESPYKTVIGAKYY